MPTTSARRAIIRARNLMNPPEKPLSDAEIDAMYGLEPVIRAESTALDSSAGAEFVVVHCPYCGEAFETRADASAGSCSYVEDCQVCCQPIEMTLRVDDDGRCSSWSRDAEIVRTMEKKVALITGAGSGIGKATALAFLATDFAWCWPDGSGKGSTRWRSRPATRRRWSSRRTSPARRGARAVRCDAREVRPTRRVVQQRRRRHAVRRQSRGPELRTVAPGDRHQSHRRVPVHAAGIPDHEGPDAARRPHHQQRLDLGARAAREFRALHGLEARHHRAHEVELARRPQVRHRGAGRSTSAMRSPSSPRRCRSRSR